MDKILDHTKELLLFRHGNGMVVTQDKILFRQRSILNYLYGNDVSRICFKIVEQKRTKKKMKLEWKSRERRLEKYDSY